VKVTIILQKMAIIQDVQIPNSDMILCSGDGPEIVSYKNNTYMGIYKKHVLSITSSGEIGF